MRRIAVYIVVVAMGAGCAARGAVRQAEPGAPKPVAQEASRDSLETFIAKVRARSLNVRPRTNQVATVEASDPGLSAALLRLTLRPSAAAHRAVAREYVRVGILDVAHEHLSAAVAIDPRDAAGWDGLARIWRDWGFAHLALPDAYRALYFAPDSPVSHNTLGTVFQALGRRLDARAQFEKALELDVTAAYALTNLCYGWVLDGQAVRATDACRQALRLRPDFEAARNNLALAYVIGGDIPAALDVFGETDERGRAEYNAGIVHLARRRYGDALKAFEAAQAARPRFRAAEVMARRAQHELQDERREGRP